MPIWGIPAREFDLPRNLALLDTNVLVAAIWREDPLHEMARYIIEENQYRWATPYGAVIEAWNFLASKNKSPAYAVELLDWLTGSEDVILLEDSCERFAAQNQISAKYQVDIVDAILMKMANDITVDIGLVPSVHIATYDTRDFMKCFGSPGLKYDVFDLRDLSSTSSG